MGDGGLVVNSHGLFVCTVVLNRLFQPEVPSRCSITLYAGEFLKILLYITRSFIPIPISL